MKALELIARTVCAAEGYEPDAKTIQYTPTLGALGHAVVHGDLVVQWQIYEPVIKAIITTLLDYAPDGEEFKAYVADVLRDVAEVPPDPPSADIIEQNWRVFYGLRR